MATVHNNSSLNRYLEEHHPIWSHVFNEQEKQSLTDEDLAAGYRIPAILTAVMIFGFLSMVVSVWLAI